MWRSYFDLFRRRRVANRAAPAFRPRVEPLEERAVPAFVPIHHPVAPHVHHAARTPVHRAAATPATPAIALAGQVSGVWSQQMTPPDTGTSQSLSGAGSVTPLGVVQASGTLHTPGFIISGYTTGTLVLVGAQGSVTLQLKGASPQPGFSPPANVLNYTIVGGTGAYAGDTGSGVAHLQETTAPQPQPGSTGTLLPQVVASGTFTLTFG